MAEPIIIVSGLPRSGTSLMMRILEVGGVPILTDACVLPTKTTRVATTSTSRSSA
ncbi:MAG: sulfotransferase [Chloroflexaceae bacterium]|nr:sulfotransferase [Chloroflexaceae bacterium]